jgi:cell division protein FtsI/penicillin-binding protein 2
MKYLIYLCLMAALGIEPASAAVEQCRQIKVKADRETCYDRQAKALAEKRQAAGPAGKIMVDPVDQLKVENDRVSRRLRSICRGC